MDMIRLSRLADYAVAIMGQISLSPSSIYNSQELAHLTNLPETTVAKILTRLRQKGVLASHRGVKGGYCLNKNMSDISLADIITAIDGPISLTLCADHLNIRCSLEDSCQSRASWQKINQAIRQIFAAVPLAELVQKAKPQVASPSAVVFEVFQVQPKINGVKL